MTSAVADPPDLHIDQGVVIQSLGGFAVFRDGSRVTESAWQSRKARAALKVLVAHCGHPVPRLALIEALWPGQDPAQVRNRLSVALSVIRGVLDPDRRFGPSRLICADADTVRLDAKRVAIDVLTFLATATAGLDRRRTGRSAEATRLLRSAERAYTGDFLDDSPYDDWAAPTREHVRTIYLQVLRAMARDAEAEGDHPAAIRRYLELLQHDRYDEPAHLDLVAALDRTGSHGEARRRYQLYVRRMADLDVAAAPFPNAGRKAG